MPKAEKYAEPAAMQQPAAAVAEAPKKADVILKNEREISAKQDELMREAKSSNSRLDSVVDSFAKSGRTMDMLAKQSTELYDALDREYRTLKQELLFLAKQNENIFLGLTEKLEQLSKQISAIKGGGAAIDSDALARKVAQAMPAQDAVSPDYIASKVAEQIVMPAVAGTVAAGSVNIDEEELADKISLKVGEIKPEDFDLLVDDEGCSSLASQICEKLDYDLIAAAVAEKLRPALVRQDEIDYEELAQRISEKIDVGSVNEDAIADKAAAALSNYLPEIDTDDIADKVATAVISAIPATLDNDAIVTGVSDKLIASQEDHDYDIVIDEDGVEKISDGVHSRASSRFDRVDEEIEEIKALLAGGAVIRAAETAATEPYTIEESTFEESLVTVSDVVEPAPDSPEEELVTVSDVVEEEPKEGDGDADMDEMVEELDEQPADGEIMPDGIPGISDDGVDFANMMKYNRSFIARIIQGSDEQKQYYGAVKTALLSYNKVNSNVAWGAERFHKGRETIARFKIRGKTLCLYLALDPIEFKTSVYHHADVSDNKSMHGTPMMVKIKSPLGVKKAIRLIDEMLARRDGVKRNVAERDYVAMYPYETYEELIEDGLVKDVSKK